MLKYEGYTGYVEFDDEAELLQGEVLDTRDVVIFQGKTVEEVRKAFRDSIDDYLEFCAERNEKPEKPFSGKFVGAPGMAHPLEGGSPLQARQGELLAGRQGCPS
jgi:predicted HicB family RNase H-like nuclease